MASGDSGSGGLPSELPVFPLTGVLLLPRGRLPLNIFEPRYLAMFDDALARERIIGMIQPSGGGAHAVQQSPPLFSVGCAGRITSFSESADGRYLVSLDGVSRFRITEELPLHRGYRRVIPDWTPFTADLNEEELTFDRGRLIELLQAYFQQQQLSANWDAIGQAPHERLLTSLAMICPFAPAEKQALLEAGCLSDRARLMMSLLEIAIAGQRGEDDRPRH
ncbi:MAG: peptidase [Rhodospirillales bacterium]|nr:peptidase [Rhodospirillales bacterium]